MENKFFFLSLNQLEFNNYSREVFEQIPVGSSQEEICKFFNNLDKNSLLSDILKNGIIEPLKVKPKKNNKYQTNRFTVTEGNRRLAAMITINKDHLKKYEKNPQKFKPLPTWLTRLPCFLDDEKANYDDMDGFFKKAIEQWESKKLEFKSSLNKNFHTQSSPCEIMRYETLLTVNAFLNTNDGNLIIGVRNNKQVVGIEKDDYYDNDKYMTKLENILSSSMGPEYSKYYEIEIHPYEGKKLCLVRCQKSESPVFLRYKPYNKKKSRPDDTEDFYIRKNSGSQILKPSSMTKYINEHF